MNKDPYLEVDDEARGLARRLIREARHGALAVVRDGVPVVTRVAVAPDGGDLLTLVSDLASHTQTLRVTQEASLLIGEPGRGDPLAYPRVTLQVRPEFIEKTDATTATYLEAQPKAQLYIGFADFHLVRLRPDHALLNGGFGKAYRLTGQDLATDSST